MAIFEPDGTVHHLGLKKGDVGRYVLLPGDPGRVEVIARRFDNPRWSETNMVGSLLAADEWLAAGPVIVTVAVDMVLTTSVCIALSRIGASPTDISA